MWEAMDCKVNIEGDPQGTTPLVLTPPEAVVVHCSDYRFRAATQEFLRRELGLHSYDLLALPGGPHFASMWDLLPKHYTVGKQHMAFLIRGHELKRIILIDHSDCSFFKHRLSFFYPEPSFNEKQIANLKRAGGVIRDWFPTLTVNAYFAEAQGDASVRFVPVG
jgi:hypothetical protein